MNGCGINERGNIHCSRVISSSNTPMFMVVVGYVWSGIRALARLAHGYEIVPIYRGESVHGIIPVVQSGMPPCGFI